MTGSFRPDGRRDRDAAGLGDDVVGPDRVALVVDEVVRAPGAERLLVGHREVDERALGAEAGRRRALRMATAIDDVRLSMSTAPRPHTSPSISSPPNGSCRQRSALTGTTSV